MAYLVDANFLLALNHKNHRHHAVAQEWIRPHNGRNSLAICRPVQMALARFATTEVIMGMDRLSAQEFWSAWDALVLDTRFVLVEEPAMLEATWRELAEWLPPGMKLDTDVYLAAFAVAGNYTFLTFDRGFLRYPGLKTEILG